MKEKALFTLPKMAEEKSFFLLQRADRIVGALAVLHIAQWEKGGRSGFVFQRHLHPILEAVLQLLQESFLIGADRTKTVAPEIKVSFLIVISLIIFFIKLIV